MGGKTCSSTIEEIASVNGRVGSCEVAESSLSLPSVSTQGQYIKKSLQWRDSFIFSNLLVEQGYAFGVTTSAQDS